MLELMMVSKSKGPWYKGDEVLAFDSSIFKGTGFTDYTGKTVTITNKVGGDTFGTVPALFGDTSFQYGQGIYLRKSSGLYTSSTQIARSTVAGDWTLDFWNRCDTAATDGIDVGFPNAYYLFAVDNIQSQNRADRLLIAPDGGFSYRISAFNNSTARAFTSTSLDLELKSTTWCHYAISYDSVAGTMRFYINGQLRRVESIKIVAPVSTNQFGIACFVQAGSQRFVIERYRFRTGVRFSPQGFDLSSIYP